MRKIFVLVFAFSMVSCLGEQKSNPEEEKTPVQNVQNEKEEPQFVLELDIEMSKPEDIRLMAVNTFLNNGKYIDIYVTQKMNANETSKTVKFELPEGISPDNFVGVSFGPKEIKEVKVNRVHLSYGDLDYNIQSENILNFFKTNDFVEYDETNNIFRTKRVDGKHNPILILRKLYIDKIQGLK